MRSDLAADTNDAADANAADAADAGAAGRSENPNRQGIQSVELAMTVLRALEDGGAAMSLSQIAAASGMRPSKAHRYLVSLSRIGLVSQSPTSGLYDLGHAMRRLGAEALRRTNEVGLASEYLPGLRDRTKHAVNISVWSEHGPVIVRWDYGSYALPITVRVGAILPLLASSAGRVFLAHLPATLTAPVIHSQQSTYDQERYTEEEIERIETEVRNDGVAFTTGAVIPGVSTVAAPVFTAADALPLAVAVAMPERSATTAVVRRVTAELRATTQAMSAELGHRPDQPVRSDTSGPDQHRPG